MLLKKYRIAKVDETVYPGIYPIINKYMVKFSRTHDVFICPYNKCKISSLCDRLFVGKSRIVHTCFNDPKTSKRKYYYYPYVIEKEKNNIIKFLE